MNDNYMKTILSGVKEWTENLTDDAIDKANNALDKANNALDKALFVVNITSNGDGTFSADKTFEEIVQAYNEGKYSIVLKYGFEEGEIFEYSFLRLDAINPAWAHFISPYHMGAFDDIGVMTVFIYNNNTIKLTDTQLAQVPTPFPLTFTGAVNETYDGSSAKTIEIPIGLDGITPTIGDNGNWYLGTTDTGKPSRGEKGDKGDTGANGQSAYAAAQAGGYTDTEANFYADLAAMQGLASALAAI